MQQTKVFSGTMQTIYIAFLTGKIVILAMCIFVWIGTWYDLRVSATEFNVYSWIAIALAIAAFFAVYRTLNKLYTMGKTMDLTYLPVFSILPIALLWFKYAFTFTWILLGGYLAGVVVAEIAFLCRIYRR